MPGAGQGRDGTADGRWTDEPRGGRRSAFVYTVTIGARGERVELRDASRAAAPGTRRADADTRSLRRRRWRAARRRASSRAAGTRARADPGESVKMYCVSSFVSSPTTGRRVDCGLGDTIARCSPTSALSSVDLPTLGRPARTTVPQRVIPSIIDTDGRVAHASTNASNSRLHARIDIDQVLGCHCTPIEELVALTASTPSIKAVAATCATGDVSPARVARSPGDACCSRQERSDAEQRAAGAIPQRCATSCASSSRRRPPIGK